MPPGKGKRPVAGPTLVSDGCCEANPAAGGAKHRYKINTQPTASCLLITSVTSCCFRLSAGYACAASTLIVLFALAFLYALYSAALLELQESV
jgi:hypothetical protein